MAFAPVRAAIILLAMAIARLMKPIIGMLAFGRLALCNAALARKLEL